MESEHQMDHDGLEKEDSADQLRVMKEIRHEAEKSADFKKELERLPANIRTAMTDLVMGGTNEIADALVCAGEILADLEQHGVEEVIQIALNRKKRQSDRTQQIIQPLATVGVKMAGSLDRAVWLRACKTKGEWQAKLRRVFLRWANVVRDSEDRPFCFDGLQTGEKDGELNHDHLEELNSLRREYGEEVHNSVITALMETQEYKPGANGGCPIAWNLKESRRCTLTEVLEYFGEVIQALVMAKKNA